jgi:bifunctional DNA-binding transcriptional regulator/antitoxin component of YhaV-PrlF toxin-antitoxin module
MATCRQTEANRLNAQKSTGPKTDEGKAHSRANSLKHGLTGAGIVLPAETAEAVDQRKDEWRRDYTIVSAIQEWLFHQVVVNSVRVDLCQEHENDLRVYLADRANHSWDVDRRDEIEQIAAALPKRPARIVARLRRSRHGCEWLIHRWQGLADVLERGLEWTEKEQALALDLLGIPLELRDSVGISPGDPVKEMVAREIERLAKFKAEALDELDQTEQKLAERGHEVVPDRERLRLRRYEASCIREMCRARAALLLATSAGAPEPESEPFYEPDPFPEPEPAAVRMAEHESEARTDDVMSQIQASLLSMKSNDVAISSLAAAPVVERPAPLKAPMLAGSLSLPSSSRPLNRRDRRAARKQQGRRS